MSCRSHNKQPITSTLLYPSYCIEAITSLGSTGGLHTGGSAQAQRAPRPSNSLPISSSLPIGPIGLSARRKKAPCSLPMKGELGRAEAPRQGCWVTWIAAPAERRAATYVKLHTTHPSTINCTTDAQSLARYRDLLDLDA